MGMVSKYSAEERADFIAMWDKGYPASRIAAAYNLTRNQIVGVLNRAEKYRHGGRPQFANLPRIQSRRAPPAPPVVDAGPAPIDGVNLLTVEPGQCRWPVGEQRSPWPMCGNQVESSRVYCAFHARHAHKPAKA